MTIDTFNNGEGGGDVRAKLNETITEVNRLTPLVDGLKADIPEEYKQHVAQGYVQREGIRGDIDVDLAYAIAMNLIGFPVAGGFYAGIIDTIKGDIIPADDYQTGKRYALILGPKEFEGGRGTSPASGLPTGDLTWDAESGPGEPGCFTRWDGLESTNTLISRDDPRYEFAAFIEQLRSLYPAPSTPGGSQWYIPAMDELELIYRQFKPDDLDNFTGSESETFPGTQQSGVNPSSDPTGTQYRNDPRAPDQSFLSDFRPGGSEVLDRGLYWTSTDADRSDGQAWNTRISQGVQGRQTADDKSDERFNIRPVRRVVLLEDV